MPRGRGNAIEVRNSEGHQMNRNWHSRLPSQPHVARVIVRDQTRESRLDNCQMRCLGLACLHRLELPTFRLLPPSLSSLKCASSFLAGQNELRY